MKKNNSFIVWLNDHIKADWIDIDIFYPKDPFNKNDNTYKFMNREIIITLRFGDKYCQSNLTGVDFISNDKFLETIRKMRDEFFLFDMHSLPSSEGKRLEESRGESDGL